MKTGKNRKRIDSKANNSENHGITSNSTSEQCVLLALGLVWWNYGKFEKLGLPIPGLGSHSF